MAYTAPHSPFQVPRKYANKYTDTIPGRHLAKRRTYAGMVECLDEAIGNLVETLIEKDLWNDTVLVFSSDNGGVGKNNAGNNWPLRGTKGSYFEGGIRAVSFVASPLLSDNVMGTTNNDFMHVVDWYPTLVEGVANVTINEAELDGVNQWDVISQGAAGNPKREIVLIINPSMRRPSVHSKYDSHSLIFDVGIHAAIRSGDMKLLTGTQAGGDWYAPAESNYNDVNANDPFGKAVWLYNVTADPNEKNDLSDSMVDVVFSLLEKLKDAYSDTSGYVKPKDAEDDCEANPAHHGGVWTNWK